MLVRRAIIAAARSACRCSLLWALYAGTVAAILGSLMGLAAVFGVTLGAWAPVASWSVRAWALGLAMGAFVAGTYLAVGGIVFTLATLARRAERALRGSPSEVIRGVGVAERGGLSLAPPDGPAGRLSPTSPEPGPVHPAPYR